MKRVFTFSLFLLIISNLVAQEITFQKPRDTIYNFRGKVKKAFLYEYQIPNSDTSQFQPNLEAKSNPSYTFYFNKKKLMTKSVSYQDDSIFKVTNYLYDENDNLIFEISCPSGTINTQRDTFKTTRIKAPYDSSFQNSYHFFEGVKTPQLTKGVQMKKYIYDTSKMTIYIVENNLKPSSKLVLDDKSRMLEYEHFRNSYSQKTTKIYEGENMIEERYESQRGIFLKYYEYDSLNRKIRQRHIYPDSSKNRTIEFQYPSKDTVFSTSLDFNNEILGKSSEITYGNKTIYIGEKKEGNKYFPSYGEVKFKDEYGNIYKRYKIDFEKGQTFVKEYHYTFY